MYICIYICIYVYIYIYLCVCACVLCRKIETINVFMYLALYCLVSFANVSLIVGRL